ncbi:MAG: response regulator [Anaerolineales bacterium]|nr:response regulator [Anaerolineales bacterium]MCB9434412.1 response regulator [Ardenticatenaceae bacterium]
MAEKPFVILLAEDNEHDIEATKRVWRKQTIANPLYIVNDGEECLDYLFRRGKYSDPDVAPLPGLLLLDLKMPKIGGLAVLEKIRADEQLQRLPVVVITTSQLQIDKTRCYNLGISAYIRKPNGFQQFTQMIQALHQFWQFVELPW